MPFAADIDPRLICMNQSGSGQRGFGSVFKVSQQLVGLFVEIENRSFADRYLELIRKVILDAVIGHKLKL